MSATAPAPADASLGARLERDSGSGVRLRAETEADRAFMAELYASVRAEEMAPVQWPEQAKRDFLHDQHRLQHDHYRKHYLGAEFLLIERDGTPIGRIYLHRTPGDIRLMDIALVPASRGQGIGARLVQALLAIADAEGCQVSLHVEPENPVQRLYARCGFVREEQRGIYDYMVRAPRQLNTAS